MKELRWGFIGCGEVCELKSGPAFDQVEDSRVVAVMSRTELKARSYAVRHGVTYATTIAAAQAFAAAMEVARDEGLGIVALQDLPQWT